MLLNRLNNIENVYVFDTKGNRVYCEAINGFWWKCEYDTRGNRVNYNDSTRWWWKCEYDLDGSERYFECSDGCLVDNRGVNFETHTRSVTV